jgi:hypothetical protein
MPHSHPIGSGMMLKMACNSRPILAAYKSSEEARKSYKGKNWRAISVQRLNIHKWKKRSHPVEGVDQYEQCPDGLDTLLNTFQHSLDFSIDRSTAFYRWRIDQYPDFKPRYFVCYNEQKQATAMLVLQYRIGKALIADFVYLQLPDLEALLLSVQSFIEQQGIGDTEVESSRLEVQVLLLSLSESQTLLEFINFYHLNPNHPDARYENSLLANWADLNFHETAMSGDILLR